MKMEILTPSGFQPFDGVARYKHTKKVKNFGVYTALDHKFIIDGKEVLARNLNDNHEDCDEYFYDPINVAGGKVYYHDNKILSHNTFFGTGDTLINAETLLSFRASNPQEVLEGGDLLIYDRPNKDHEYLMMVDVSKGRGQDYSTFNVIDISMRPFKQVAVYRNNTISPILFPNIIYKYANLYNEAYTIIESNDQGTLVCQGLYQDLEYENIHMESAIKSDRIGIEMNRKVKRLGCSAIKDILETTRLDIVDENTILEISTFVSKGQSYEASDGNHDDLMMNLVMFGYFVSSQFFADMTDINLKEIMFEKKMKEIEDDVPPVGFIDDGLDAVREEEAQKDQDWHTFQGTGVGVEDW